jgi:hypothetical protein
MGLMNDIDPGPVALDAVIFIYFIEEHPQFLQIIEPLFREVDKGRIEFIASALSLLEVLVVPYGTGHHVLANRYEHQTRRPIHSRDTSSPTAPLAIRCRLRSTQRECRELRPLCGVACLLSTELWAG